MEHKLSRRNEALLLAYNKGYRIIDGRIWSPKNRFLKGRWKSNSGIPYLHFSVKLPKSKISVCVSVHRLVALEKFGLNLFAPGVVCRHLDGNSRNNLHQNIGIGSHGDNMMDKPPELRLRQAVEASAKNRLFSDSVMQEIRARYKTEKSYKKIMLAYGISSKGTLWNLLNTEYQTSI